MERCSAQTLERFLAAGRIEVCPDGAMLTTRGKPMESLIVVLRGSLEVGVQTSTGKRYVVRFMEPGQIQGVIPILDGKHSIHDTRAHGESIVLLVPKSTFAEALANDTGLGQSLLQLFCARSRSLYDGVAAHALSPAKARLARALLSLLPAYGLPRGNTVALSIKLSQDELATLVGVSRQRLNKELKEFENDSIVSIAYSQIEILDRDALVSIASMDM
ncbi:MULTISPECIES: Crp/Fnr family transcriptional regulator [unclassified Cupriavidus]|uniref:Crp/Fnr family transcriptional regulator n=1 Tax=unclassified Cupriavidus TaxID=2640874 RepID=UPI0032E4E562